MDMDKDKDRQDFIEKKNKFKSYNRKRRIIYRKHRKGETYFEVICCTEVWKLNNIKKENKPVIWN